MASSAHYAQGDKLRYDAERWLATAIYDAKGNFVGTFDPRLDSLRDVNYSGAAIDLGDYVANPDHKSIPVREVPEQYWQCLVYHEDRNLGGVLNPFGIDLLGVLKIPFSTLRRSIARGAPCSASAARRSPMQLVRVIYKTPPDAGEGALLKLKRKLGEWWLAPVIYRELTRDGSDLALKQWAANHLWLAQRTGGAPLHGIEVTSPHRLRQGGEGPLHRRAVRAGFRRQPADHPAAGQRAPQRGAARPLALPDRGARAHVRGEADHDEALQKQVVFELIAMAGGPPDPQIKPQAAAGARPLRAAAGARAQANPVIRANALMPAARYGIREEMKQAYGFGWRDHVRGVTTTFDAADNLAFGEKEQARFAAARRANTPARSTRATRSIPAKVSAERKSPNVIVAAANAQGEIVRYFEQGETASYFGSPFARDAATGFYDAAPRKPHGRLDRQDHRGDRDRQHHARYAADALPRPAGAGARARSVRARQRAARAHGDRHVRLLAQRSAADPHRARRPGAHRQAHRRVRLHHAARRRRGRGTPPSTAVVLGQVAASPRRVHRLAGVVLASLIGRGATPVRSPSLVKAYDFTSPESAEQARPRSTPARIRPDNVISAQRAPLLRTLLQAPLCYEAGGRPTGTLKSLSQWCAARRADLRLHFAKTGTQVTDRPRRHRRCLDRGRTAVRQRRRLLLRRRRRHRNSAAEPWARNLHAAQVAAPLLGTLLQDLEADARKGPRPAKLRKPVAVPAATRPRGAQRAR